MSTVAPIHSNSRFSRTIGTAREVTCRYSPEAVSTRKVCSNIDGSPSAARDQRPTSSSRSAGWMTSNQPWSIVFRQGRPVSFSQPGTSSVIEPSGRVSQTSWETAEISASYRWRACRRSVESCSAWWAEWTSAVVSIAATSTPGPSRVTAGEQL